MQISEYNTRMRDGEVFDSLMSCLCLSLSFFNPLYIFPHILISEA